MTPADGTPAGDGSAREVVCEEVIRFLDDYVSGTLTDELRAAFEAHLAICPQCVDYIASYRRIIELARDSADSAPPALPGTLPNELVRLILSSRPR